MSRNRFKLILQFLHFADNGAGQNDKLSKLSPLLDLLLRRFKEVYMPQRDISVDEELILFKGRVGFKQYIPSKRSRFGIKAFALCDTKGYYYDASIYVGKPDQPLPHTDTLGAPGAIVVHLLGHLANKGYRMFVDNWYTSIPLADHMTELGTGFCGTMRANTPRYP